MKVKLLKKIRKRYDVVPNINKRYGFYIISKHSGNVIANHPYGSGYATEVLIRILFGFMRSTNILRIHEENQSDRKSRTILKRLGKQQK